MLASEIDDLLGLHAAHGAEQFTAALTRAVAIWRFKAADLRSIVAAGPTHQTRAGLAT